MQKNSVVLMQFSLIKKDKLIAQKKERTARSRFTKAYQWFVFVILYCWSSIAFSAVETSTHQIYLQMGLNNKLSFWKFHDAYHHYMQNPTRNKVFTIIDFGKPSNKKRFWVIDIENRRVLHSTYVAHGINSGDLYALDFSNELHSKKSSLGVYWAAETYYGKYGYSLRLDGLSKGLNDNARQRAIVIHGAEYAHPKNINTHGTLGTSWGCPAIPYTVSTIIIDAIKNGTYIYAYS